MPKGVPDLPRAHPRGRELAREGPSQVVRGYVVELRLIRDCGKQLVESRVVDRVAVLFAWPNDPPLSLRVLVEHALEPREVGRRNRTGLERLQREGGWLVLDDVLALLASEVAVLGVDEFVPAQPQVTVRSSRE